MQSAYVACSMQVQVHKIMELSASHQPNCQPHRHGQHVWRWSTRTTHLSHCYASTYNQEPGRYFITTRLLCVFVVTGIRAGGKWQQIYQSQLNRFPKQTSSIILVDKKCFATTNWISLSYTRQLRWQAAAAYTLFTLNYLVFAEVFRCRFSAILYIFL